MDHRLSLFALGLTLALALACGGGRPEPVVVPEVPLDPVVVEPEAIAEPAPPEAPAEEPLAKPLTTQAGTLMVRKKTDGDCNLWLLTLPALTERELAPVDCDSQQYKLEHTGKRMLGDGWLIDLEAGALVELPELPPLDNVYLTSHEFDAEGGIFATQEWGSGEETFEEGTSWEVRHGNMYRLQGETWVEGLAVVFGGDDPSPEALLQRWYTLTSSGAWSLVYTGDGAGEDWVSDEGLRDTLSRLADAAPDDWFVSTEEPRLAYGTVMAGEGSELQGPALIQEGDTWSVLEGVPEYPDSMGRRGDWLLVGERQGWKLFDLRARAAVAEGAGMAWFWPEDVPQP